MSRPALRALGRPRTYRLLLGRWRREALPPAEAAGRALDWLLVAHRAVDGRGFATHYSLADGWGPPYPETSGYIIPTLLDAHRANPGRDELEAAARSTGRWLLRIQHADGAFDAPATGTTMVFDTGQVIFGLLAMDAASPGDGYLDAARRAGEWLLAQQDPGGFWRRHAYRDIPHTYYARVSWALALLARRVGDDRFAEGARRQLRWVLEQQRDDGWFSSCSFHADERPILHVIAYTIRGLWESASILDDRSIRSAAERAAEALARRERGRGWLESHFGPGWEPLGRSVCLTGLCQMAIVWLRMARATGRDDLRALAHRCLDFVGSRQVRSPGHPDLHGTLPGSAPLWGSYFPWSFPNWGVKFFVDAMLARDPNGDPALAG